MSRSIKFRGQREDTKEWVYGSLCKAKNSIFIVYGDDFYQNIIIDSVCLMSDRFFKAISNTVGQFTGRTDDGGDELYDGDIISFDYELKSYEGVIQWSEALSAFVVKRKEEDPLFLYDIDDAVTKIGDIYGN